MTPCSSMKARALAPIAAQRVGARYRHGEACSDRRSIWSRQEATAGGISDMAGGVRPNGCRSANPARPRPELLTRREKAIDLAIA